MAKEYKLPDLGENLEGGDVLTVFVKAGDSIVREQSLFELETDKAVLEVPAPFTGTVEKVLVQVGDHVKVGQPVLSFDPAPAQSEPASQPDEDAAEDSPPEATDSPAEDRVSSPEPAPEPPAPTNRPGKLVEFSRPAPPASDQPVPASPSVRRLAREIGVDIRLVVGSGRRGRISRDDVKAYAQRLLTGGPTPVTAPGSLPDFSNWGEISRERMSAVRRATAVHMARSWSQIPHVTQIDESDITQLEARRKHYSARVEQEGGKLTVTAILLKVLASAVARFPQFGASLDVAQEEIIYKKYVHVGVAVDTPRGLLVPVIRDVNQKNLIQLSREMKEAAGRAREGKLSLEEMRGGCITITNLGGIGGTSFTPIVNWPEVAILGVSRAAVKPLLDEDDEFVPRLVMPLSLSYDHRLIDGADGARFLRWICQTLEDPFLLTLEG